MPKTATWDYVKGLAGKAAKPWTFAFAVTRAAGAQSTNDTSEPEADPEKGREKGPSGLRLAAQTLDKLRQVGGGEHEVRSVLGSLGETMRDAVRN